MSSERIFQGNDQQWYFTVRGNQAEGPFASRPEAETQLSRHVATCRNRVEGRLRWPRVLRPARLLRRLRPDHRTLGRTS